MTPANYLEDLRLADALEAHARRLRERARAADERANLTRYGGGGSVREQARHIAAQLRAVGRKDVTATVSKRLGISKRYARTLVNGKAPAPKSSAAFFE